MRESHPSLQSREDGFTLIEVIVGLALLALTAAMLAGIVTGSRQVFRVLAANEAGNSVLPVQTYLRTALAHTSAAVTEQSDAGAPPVLVGGADRLIFSTTHAQHGQFQGMYRVELGLRPPAVGTSGFDLVVTEALSRPTDVPNPHRRSVVLANVAGLALSYFGKSADEDAGWEWSSTWPYAGRLPTIVRINVIFPQNDARIWYPLDVRLNRAN